MENEASEKELARVARIYRVASDGSIESVDSAYLDTGEEVAMFICDKGVVIIIGRAARIGRDT